jgi:hypothetical protein
VIIIVLKISWPEPLVELAYSLYYTAGQKQE